MVSNVSQHKKVLHSSEKKPIVFNSLLKKDRLFRRSKHPKNLLLCDIFLIVDSSEKRKHLSILNYFSPHYQKFKINYREVELKNNILS
jgi:hypothetical protein